jgi:CheY-like chemotaxis protein
MKAAGHELRSNCENRRSKAQESEEMMAKVLVIDDDLSARHAMTTMLKQVGHEPHASGDPAEAINTALSFKPEVLVADWILKPDYTGLEVAETLRAAHPNLGLVFITGVSPEEVEEKAEHLKPFRVVSKPCEFFRLFEAVQDVSPKEVESA